MDKTSDSPAAARSGLPFVRWHRVYLDFFGRRLLHVLQTVQGLGAFALITFGVALTQFKSSRRVIHPLIWAHVYHAGVKMMPVVVFLGCALGFAVVGQTVFQLSRVGSGSLIGTVMVSVVMRELGPLLAAFLVLTRVGTGIVIDLGTIRAMGEVEAMEALGIDPVHYLVLPRVIGLAVSIFALTVYLVLLSLGSGYLFAFLQDVPLPPMEYFRQIADGVRWEDFLLLGLKTVGFGVVIAIIACYEGLARPLRLEEVSDATTAAVLHGVVACVLLDALFIVIYLLI